MKKFIQKIVLFSVLFAILVLAGVFAPTTPRASKSLLFAKINKDHLLKDTPSPRIVFVGGSNLSFGLNSNTIKDSLQLNPINTAIHASIGLRYMLDNTLQYLKKDDVIVVVPEYIQFYTENTDCSTELARVILDVQKTDFKLLRTSQYISFLSELPKYVLTKLTPGEYWGFEESDIHSVNSFNKYGDVFVHWDMEKRDFYPDGKALDNGFNYSILQELLAFKNCVEKKGAKLFVSYPCYQDSSFENQEAIIRRIESEYNNANLAVLGTPQRYKMGDSLMFNTSYHLNKRGVDVRTELLIEDLKSSLF